MLFVYFFRDFSVFFSLHSVVNSSIYIHYCMAKKYKKYSFRILFFHLVLFGLFCWAQNRSISPFSNSDIVLERWKWPLILSLNLPTLQTQWLETRQHWHYACHKTPRCQKFFYLVSINRLSSSSQEQAHFFNGTLTKPSQPDDPLFELWKRCNDMVVS